MSMVNDLIGSLLQRINPTFAGMYAQYMIMRLLVNGVIFLPFTFVFTIIFGGSWVVSYFVGIAIGLITVGWKGQGRSAGSNLATPMEQSVQPASSTSVPPTPTRQKAYSNQTITCKKCTGKGYNETESGPIECGVCHGYGSYTIQVRKPTSIGKLPPIAWMMIYLIGGIALAGVGTRIPVIGQYIELTGVGIMVLGLILFKPKPKAQAAAA